MEGLMSIMKNKVNKLENLIKPLFNLIFILALIRISWEVKLDIFIYILGFFYIFTLYFLNSTYLAINAVIFSIYIAINTFQTGIRYDLIILNLAFPYFHIFCHHNYRNKHIKLNSKDKKGIKVALDSIQLPLILLDKKGQIIMSNKTFKDMIFCNVTLKNIFNLVENDYINEINKAFYSAINKRIPSYTKSKLKNFKDEDITLLFHPMSYFNKNLCLCLLFCNSDKNVSEDMKSIIDNFYSNEQLRSEFYANLAHELRTPINVILASLQMLNIYVSKEESVNKYMHIMKQNCLRLLRLINNLIDATKIDAGFLSLNFNNYNIVSIVENIVQSVVEYASTQGIEVVFDTDEEEVVVACDPDKIERIVLNLLSNSIKFTPRGGSIFVLVNTSKEYVKVSIKDTGCGIPKEKLGTIFDRYKQVENRCMKNGSGIGLSLVKSLTELHGGFVEVESEEGVGSTFSFSIPIKTIETVNKNEIFKHNLNVEKIDVEFSDIYS
ncbi:HAMP domain-containing sensor histidine kinase [Caloramator sp. mosi_1]|uniref:sensor histidine kinase n=1 Tax=Caloramator sp. mosi_1 TaxID=3023090 RepID=UPI00235F77C9|nr:HAMP domain-containing sensor histidine kinase [Caloramator sp. mosi_1]WDC84475.1 HAMP domain-containing sensor histidine kinase [Caloramator sp. mosi_1]